MKVKILFNCIFLFNILIGQTNLFRFEQLSVDQGLSQSSVLCICQDKQGFMWFGTYNGLNRFDGYQFKVYKNDEMDSMSISHNAIRHLIVDHSGILWIATEGGLNRYDREHDVFIRYYYDSQNPNSVANNRIQSIYEDLSKTLWICTENGLSRYVPDKDHFINYRHDPDNPYSLSNNRIRAICQAYDSTYWIGTDNGLNVFDSKAQRFMHYMNEPGNANSISENMVSAILEDHTRTLWVCTWGGGLCQFDRQKKIFHRYLNHPNNPFSLSHNIVRTIMEDREGNLWIGTYEGGLNIYDRANDRFNRYQNEPTDITSISKNAIYAIYEDHSGIIWIGTDFGGVNKLNRRKAQFNNFLTTLQSDVVVKSNTINAIFQSPETKQNILWLGTWGSGLIRFNMGTKEMQIFKHDSGNPFSINSDIVRCIQPGSKESLWIGTEQGLSYFDTQTKIFQNYKLPSTSPSDLDYHNVFAILEDQKHQVWVGSYYGGLYQFNQNTHTYTHYPARLNDSTTVNDYIIWCLFEDSNQDLWIGTETGGLNYYNMQTGYFKAFQKNPHNTESINCNKVLCIFEDQKGFLWLGTSAGLNRMDRKSEKFVHYTMQNGLPSNTIQSILGDKEGLLWISTTQGVSRFDPETEIFQNFTMSDGLPCNEFYVNSCENGKNGELYFGGINGFTFFHPQDIYINQYVPPVVITDFKIFGESVPIGLWHEKRVILKESIDQTKQIELQYYDDMVSFEFAAMDFTSPDENEYATILEGLETEWDYLGNQHHVTYHRLMPGNYTLRIKASNNNKIWNEDGISLRIKVKPALWDTLWFRLILLFCVLIIIFGTHRLRVRVIHNRNQQLEQINKTLNDEVQERKLAESRVQASLQEKEVLLKEIHHRVKNNMQIICSLLSLQSNRIKDPELLNIFTESQHRVRAMALIHERLYQTQDLNHIDLRVYISDLAHDLMTSYTRSTDKIKFKIEVNDFNLPVKLTIPCGLVINELVSNAIKYAFPIKRDVPDEILVQMTDHDDEIELRVEDNGIGIPEEIQATRNVTLGLKLVDILVKQQLQGDMQCHVNNGTSFLIRFNRNEF